MEGCCKLGIYLEKNLLHLLINYVLFQNELKRMLYDLWEIKN